jgi:hypothetical protein
MTFRAAFLRKMSLLVVLSMLHMFCPAGQGALKGGCAKVNITPPLGIPLIGSYGKPSDDILDEFYARALVLNEQTEGGVCLFALGTAGDIVPYQRGVKAHQQIGRALGAEALHRLQPAGTWAGQFVGAADDVTLDAVKKEVEFPAKKLVSADDEKEVALATPEADKVAEYMTTEMQILRLGDIYILGLPSEVLVEVGLEIKKRAGIEKLFVISLSNDAIGYVCHSRAYEEGGYEPGSATNLAKGAGEIMTEEALYLIKQIRQTRRVSFSPPVRWGKPHPTRLLRNCNCGFSGLSFGGASFAD